MPFFVIDILKCYANQLRGLRVWDNYMILCIRRNLVTGALLVFCQSYAKIMIRYLVQNVPEHHEEVNLQNKGKPVSYKTLVTTELENIGPTFSSTL